MKKTAAAVMASALIITLSGTTVFARNCPKRSYIPDAITVSVADSVTNAVTGLKNIVYNHCNQYNQCDYCDADGYRYTDADGDGICDHRVSVPANDCPNYDGSAQYNKNYNESANQNNSSPYCGGNSRIQSRQGRR